MPQPRRSPTARTAAKDKAAFPEASSVETAAQTAGYRDSGVPVLVPSIGHIPVPTVHVARVHMPHVPSAPQVHVPTVVSQSTRGRRGMLLWWGGLAGGAAIGVLEWPVAAAVAIGTLVAERAVTRNAAPTIPPPASAAGEDKSRETNA